MAKIIDLAVKREIKKLKEAATKEQTSRQAAINRLINQAKKLKWGDENDRDDDS